MSPSPRLNAFLEVAIRSLKKGAKSWMENNINICFRERFPHIYVNNKLILNNFTYETDSVGTAERYITVHAAGKGALALLGMILLQVIYCPSMGTDLISIIN